MSHKPPSGAGDLKYISKYLIQYVPAPQKKAEAKRVGGARILTSSECFSILKEREEKKRIEAEAKAKRKIEREKRKEEREAIAKRKAEERAKKAAERNSRSKNRAPPKVKTSVPKRRKVDEEGTSSAEPVSGTKQRHTSKNPVATRKKRMTAAAKNDSTINPNECCVCFRTFQEDEIEKTGLEWVECVCMRWLHEDCIDYVTDVDVNGRELLCPFCCV